MLPRPPAHQAHPAPLRDLAARARAGSADALAELYGRFARPLTAVAFHLTRSAADAEDVLHDVFVGLPEALRHYDERGALESWLKRVTARVALSRLRAARRRREVAIDAAPPDAALGAPAERGVDDLAAVQRALDRLPEALRTVFVLREVEGYSHAEIAAMLAISPRASEVRLHRAIRALRAQLGGAR